MHHLSSTALRGLMLLAVLAAGCSDRAVQETSQEDAAVSLIPGDGVIGLLKCSKTPPRWSTTEAELFNEINGGAEQVIKHGWRKTLTQDCTWKNARINIRIHVLSSADKARQLYLNRKPTSARPIPGLNNACIDLMSTSIQALLAHKHYLVEITSDSISYEQEVASIISWMAKHL